MVIRNVCSKGALLLAANGIILLCWLDVSNVLRFDVDFDIEAANEMRTFLFSYFIWWDAAA